MITDLDEARISESLAVAQDRDRYPVYQYPWPELESDLRSREDESMLLLGYGSLLSQASAARTIDTSEKAERRPALAVGARRRFSYKIPQAFLAERYGVLDGTEYAALDCDVTYQGSDLLNGILTRLFAKDVEAFRKREYAYSLKPVPIFDWADPELAYRIGYILDCPPEGAAEDHPFATDIPPQPGYYRLCRDGAASVSESFLDLYLDSTYLGDGVTSIRDWEKGEGAAVLRG